MKKIKLSIMALLLASTTVYPCTSIAWNTNLGTFTTRTNDWLESSNPRLMGIKKGTTKDLTGYGTGIPYTTKYDILGIFSYDGLVHDAVNSEGLQVNALFYTEMSPSQGDIEISQFIFAEYLLANFATVEEVVENLNKLALTPTTFDNMPLNITLHWSVTDKTGDRVVIEHDKDGVSLYRGEEAMIMTNEPSQQYHLNNVAELRNTWENSDRDTDIGSTGNTNSKDRFIHANYYASKMTEPNNIDHGLVKLAGIPFRIPHDAPYTDMGAGRGYGTEWVVTQNLNTGDAIFEYRFEDKLNTVKYNFYDLMGTDINIDLTTEQLPEEYR